MVLLDPIVQIAVGPVFHARAQLSPNRAWITVVPIRGDARGSSASDLLGRAKERFRRRHVTRLAESHIDQGATPIDGAVKIAPLPLNLDVCFIHVPTAPDPAFTPPPQTVDQGRGELRLPVANSLVTELDPTDQKHFGQVTQAE